MIIDGRERSRIEQLAEKSQDEMLAFTSGCFDLLHVGHIYLLREGRNLIENDSKFLKSTKKLRVIVALHSDKFVKAKKGQNRPIYSQGQRSILVESIKGVDDVIIWHGWEDIIDLVRILKPNYFIVSSDKLESAKSQNWKNDWYTVSEELNANLIPIPKVDPEISTTQFLKRIRS